MSNGGRMNCSTCRRVLLNGLFDFRCDCRNVEVDGADSVRLVSLGIFPKKRLPDLRVFDASETELPLLRRLDRTRAITSLLLQDVVDAIGVDPIAEKELTELAYSFVSRQPAQAQPKYELYASRLRALAGSETNVEPHLTFAEHFVHNTHVLAATEQTATGYQLLTYRYSERIRVPRRPRLSWSTMSVKLLLRYWGMTLGLLAVPFDLKLSGASHAHSYYLLVSPPSGTEVEALYWRFLDQRSDGGTGKARRARRLYPRVQARCIGVLSPRE